MKNLRFAFIALAVLLFGLVMPLGFTETARAADPILDARVQYNLAASDAIRLEAYSTFANPVPYNFLDYNLTHTTSGAACNPANANCIHDRHFFALYPMNARGWKLTVSRDFCERRTSGSTLCKADLNFGYKNAQGTFVPFFGNDDPVGTSKTIYAPNSTIHIACKSGTEAYTHSSFASYGYPMIFSAERLESQHNRNFRPYQVYCEKTPPNLGQYPNTSPPGYPAGGETLDWRDHGYILTFRTTACNDGIDNDGDGLTDAQDPACRTNPEDPNTYDPGLDDETVDNVNRPGPSTLTASDGTDLNSVRLTWTASSGATSYRIYRSQFQGTQGTLLIGNLTGLSYNDTTAVPGVTYYYTLIPRNQWGDGPSSTDSGFRGTPTGEEDCDGDGATDAEETADGTDPCDPGSFQLHLRSPAFTKYNVYLSQRNYLEVIANGTNEVRGTVTVYDINGAFVNSQQFILARGQELDFDILQLIGGRIDTYGVVKIDFNYGPGTTILGRMANYRTGPDGTTDFAFAKELRNPTRGDTYATGNSFDAQGVGFLIPNWGEVVNLDEVTRRFLVNLYDQSGVLLYSREISVPRYGEQDVQAGHEFGQTVTLFEVKPLDGATKYLSYVSRYSSEDFGGNEAASYKFAFALEARAGNGTPQYAPIQNRVGGCYTQTNWTEVVNTREIPVLAKVWFRSSAGEIVGSTDLPLQPKSQFHLNASALLEKGTDGSYKIESNVPGSLVTQSLVYYHDCSANQLQTAFSTQGRIPAQDVSSGTMNSFLGMKNELFVASTTTDVAVAKLDITPFGFPALPQQTLNVGANAQALNVLNAQGSGFPVNAYGVVRLETTRKPRTIAPFVNRYLEVDGRMQYIFSTLVQ